MGGIMTARMGDRLSHWLGPQGYQVLYDHGVGGADNVGQLASWYSSVYSVRTRLALVDIAVVAPASDKVLALVEVEETTDKPKVLLGDVCATLMGDGIRFKGKRTLEVGAWTHLMVLGYSTVCNPERTAYLQGQVCTLRQYLGTRNASIGQVCLDTFANECQLEAKLRRYVAAAVGIVWPAH